MATVYYQNVRGMRTKTNEILANILQNSYDILAFTETWLNQGINSNEFIDSRYVVHRRDRVCSSHNAHVKKDGGGVLLAVSRKFDSVRLSTWESTCEDIWVMVEMRVGKNIKKVAICTVYLPPPVKLIELNIFLDNANNYINIADEVILLGDFNLPFIKWSKCDNFTKPSNCGNLLGNALVDFISISNMYQLNHVCNEDDRTLDLAISTILDISITEPMDALSKLDHKHPPIVLTLPEIDIKYLRPKCVF
ncbi:hypothetical protein O3G_MSEX000397 [Manduca sexta]|nr:hypothetical protein O3G_MSEX000397 [Manduca sexta]